MGRATRITNWGNGLGLRLPQSTAREVALHEGDAVDLAVENGAIVIRPLRAPYSLDQLVGRITTRNRHRETEWVRPVGNEAW